MAGIMTTSVSYLARACGLCSLSSSPLLLISRAGVPASAGGTSAELPSMLSSTARYLSGASSLETASHVAETASTSRTEPQYPNGQGWLWRTLKKPKVYPGWFPPKLGPDGKPVPKDPFANLYWGAAAFGILLIFGPRTYLWYKTPKPDAVEEARKAGEKQAALEAKQKAFMAAVVSGKSFLEVEDAYEGLSPKEINEMAASLMGKSNVSDDPFEGMTPEEIDAYAELHGLQ